MKRKEDVRRSFAVSVLLLGLLFLLPLWGLEPLAAERMEQAFEKREEDPAEQLDEAVTLRVLDHGTVREMTLRTYLEGVLRAEMPASFSLEALKAQATAARTYTLYKIKTGGNHQGTAEICTDFACCQAWLEEETARKNWGAQAEQNEEKIRRAVRETDGMVILREGAPILAVFHSSSAGRTRASGSVWQSDLPYLQSVSSPEKGEGIPNYYSTARFTGEEFRTRVREKHPEAQLDGPMDQWLRNAVTEESGSVERITVGGVEMKGTELRGILGLRSACFEWKVQDGAVIFYVTGFGHGVGMSQYGANCMAGEGADYREILTHYYTGVCVERGGDLLQDFTRNNPA